MYVRTCEHVTADRQREPFKTISQCTLSQHSHGTSTLESRIPGQSPGARDDRGRRSREHGRARRRARIDPTPAARRPATDTGAVRAQRPPAPTTFFPPRKSSWWRFKYSFFTAPCFWTYDLRTTSFYFRKLF